MKKIKKSELIIDSALELLKTQGDHGLSMRQVAQKTEISLSNVQYYFKSKDELLKAMADRYFNACLDHIRTQPPISTTDNLNTALSEMLHEYLEHGIEISEMCRVFREYWAIATRNEAIEEYLVTYYSNLLDAVAERLKPIAANQQALSTAVSIIIPYVEGYTITAKALPKDIEQINTLLTSIVASALLDEE